MLLSPILAMTLTSTTFKNDTTVPKAMVCRRLGGGDRSPELSWKAVPKGTKSLALIAHDPDAPRPGGFYHWVVPSIPAGVKHFAAAVNGYGEYLGMCPPPGKVHHYHFTLYALDTVIDNSAPLSGPELLKLMHGHILRQATLTGLYEVRQ